MRQIDSDNGSQFRESIKGKVNITVIMISLPIKINQSASVELKNVISM